MRSEAELTQPSGTHGSSTCLEAALCHQGPGHAEECAKTLPATCSAWPGTLALAKEQELPLRVPERTAGEAALHGSLRTVRRPGVTHVCAVIRRATEGRGQKGHLSLA